MKAITIKSPNYYKKSNNQKNINVTRQVLKKIHKKKLNKKKKVRRLTLSFQNLNHLNI